MEKSHICSKALLFFAISTASLPQKQKNVIFYPTLLSTKPILCKIFDGFNAGQRYLVKKFDTGNISS